LVFAGEKNRVKWLVLYGTVFPSLCTFLRLLPDVRFYAFYCRSYSRGDRLSRRAVFRSDKGWRIVGTVSQGFLFSITVFIVSYHTGTLLALFAGTGTYW
jgi:hypothetical protein